MRKTLLWFIGIIPAVLFSQSKDTLHDLQVLDPASVSCSIKGVAVSGATEAKLRKYTRKKNQKKNSKRKKQHTRD